MVLQIEIRRRLVGDAAEEIEHEEEGGVVEDRAHRPDENHELLDVLDVPLARLLQVLVVDAVGGDPHLREVVEQVVDENLDGRHRQEGKKVTAADDREHVSEVRARAHLDVLGDVAEDPSALEDSVLEHQQAFFQQDDVG